MGIFRDFTREANSRSAKEVAAIRDADQARNDAAMQAVSSSVMIADENNVIVKVNPAATRMMQRVEGDLRKELPDFSASEMVGKNIDQFHKHPHHQRKLLSELNSTYEATISVGKIYFSLTASPIFNEQRERIGTVVEWVDITESLALKEKEQQTGEMEKVKAAEFQRIKSALDQVTSNVMIADPDNNIIYANSAVLEMLSEAEGKLRTELPKFEASKVVGSNVDVFHKNPAHQSAILAKLQTTYSTQIAIADQHYRLNATPVKSEDGERIGTVVEWVDLTDEVAFYDSLNSVLSSALEGDMSRRLEFSSKAGGYFEAATKNINAILEVCDSVLKDVSQAISALAEGRLTQKMKGDYAGDFAAIKEAVNLSIERILSVVTDISDSSFRVKSSASEISNGNSNLSKRTEQQAASLEETSSAMEEITATVQQNAENSIQANTLARGARETAENGGSVVGQAIDAMQAISDSSNKITDIIGVIDEIAFQTNLLALNAAVEAARAGDQGRGFAVVADEVRSLAGRSATAAKEIKGLIKDSSEKVSEGSELVNRSGETLGEIVTAVKKVNDIVAEIATASDEQSTGLAEINKAIVEMDSVTQQNAALVEEAAAASESMNDEAGHLEKLISFFVTGIEKKESGARNTMASSLKPGAPLSTERSYVSNPPTDKVEENKVARSNSAAQATSRVATKPEARSHGKVEAKAETMQEKTPESRVEHAPAEKKAESVPSSPEDEGDEWEVF